MRSLSLCMIVIMTMAPISSLSAATGDAMTSTASTNSTDSLSAALDTLTAAPVVTPSAGSAIGEYKSVNCNSNSSFTVNSCDQCFDGGSVKVGTRITGLFDSWTNPTANLLIAYKDEQKTPNMVKFGNSVWTTTPASEAGVFKYSSDVVWTSAGTGSKSSFSLSPSTKAKFLEADIGAGYTLDKTDKKSGEMVGILKFPLVSHSINLQTAAEGPADTHIECVAYKLDAPAAPVTPTPPKVVPPKEMTKTETGPETLLLIAAAFFIAFGLMFTLRRRV